MSLTQKTFFGASIRSFNASIGWNDSVSTMSVELVEDPDNGDSFQKPGMGTPAFFNYDGWEFNGIVQNWKQVGGTEGSPLYSINITDPRDLLDGVELILDGYTGATSAVPNLINVYGYLESIQFGGSKRNESGIPWINVRSVTQTLTLGATTFGGPVQFRGSTYAVDLTGLQPVPTTYRIGGTSISLLGFISEMCAAASADFFVTLRLVNGVKVIVINTISRRLQPTFGKINRFISTTAGARSKEVGFELRNEVTSKFVSGGAKQEMYIQFYDPIKKGIYDDDTIWPYWGLDPRGDAIIGTGLNDDHQFRLDARMVDVPGVGEYYPTDVGEMRAAVDSQAAWETYLTIHSPNEDSIHHKKAQTFNIVGNTITALVATLGPLTLQQAKSLGPLDILNVPTGDSQDEETISRLYSYIKEYADQYYGRQFMVRIPFVSAKKDENDQIITSREVTDGGYIAEKDYPYAVSSRILPSQFDRLSLPDGRFQAYVRFRNANNYDLSQVNPDDIVINGNDIFVKCSVQPNLVFTNKKLAFSPRAVVELAGPVFLKDANFDGVLRTIIGSALEEKGSDTVKQDLDRIFSRFGGDALAGANGGSAVLPDLAAVPLKSNIDSYGPWQAVGAQGKAEFEKDDSLVPWNYGGYNAMNAVGSAKVQLALANQQVAENGSVEYPGTPARELGQTLIAGGPYVTDVSVNIGEGGVTTTYGMNTWTPEFGTFAKQRAEQIQKISQKAQQDRRNARQASFVQGQIVGNRRWKQKQVEIINRKKPNSSHQLLAGDMIANDEDDEDLKPNVVTLPTYHAIGKVITDEPKGAISMDGLFRPFGEHDLLASWSGNSSQQQDEVATASSLNPFSGTNDIQYIMHDDDGNQSPMAFRGPMILAGWGFDIDDGPVPVDPNDEDEFLPDYRIRYNQWKVGPIDLRWDNDRGVWTGGQGTPLRAAKILTVNSGTSEEEDNNGPLTGTMKLVKNPEADEADINLESETLDYYNFIKLPICPDQRVWVSKVNKKWHIINAEHTGVDVVTNVECDPETGFTVSKRTIYLGAAFGNESVCDAGE